MIKENFIKLFLTFIVLIGLTGCLSSTSSTDKLSQIGAQSCLSAVPVAFDGVMVTIDIPDEVVKFMIKRDGVPILETTDKSVTTKIDTGLVKGQTYRYTCAAILDVNDGYKDLGQELSVTLSSETAPDFGGITDAYPEGANSIRLEWGLSSGEVISHYKIYKYVGIATNKSQFSNAPIATLYDLALTNYLAEGLGDQIDYSFRVVACNTSNICDDNNAIETAVLADTGVPLTTGISDIGIINGEVRLTVPWDDTRGLVSKRTVYRYQTTTGTACPADVGLYAGNDINVSAPINTPISFNAPGSISQGVRYCYLVRDTDSLGQQELNTAFRFIDVGDLTPPVFNTSLTLDRDPSFPENRLFANWLAIENESENALAGASEYVVYLSSATPPAQPDADPCSTGTQYGAPVSAASFPQGMNVQVPISGLNPRSNYRICVRAKDSSGNFATNEPKALRSTGDITPPLFNGVDNALFNGATAQIDVQFLIPNDLDVGNYLIKISRNRGGVVTQISDIPIIIGVQQPGSTFIYSLTEAQASAQSDDILTIRVDACDNANPTYASSDNCTLTSVSRNVVIPDSEPPADFQLISYTVQPGSAESSVALSWTAPPNWNDYAGFKVHYVEGGALVGLDSSDCVCSGLDCEASPKTSCEVFRTDGSQFLDSSRQYEFYLSAYDTEGFSTEQYIDFTGGNKKTAFARTRDRTQPDFNADFTSEISNGIVLNFDPATDNQYVGAPGNHEVTYQIYRKVGSTFSFPCVSGDTKDPDCDGASSLIATRVASALTPNGGKLSYTDTNINDGVTYFYQVCAHDFAYSDTNNPFNSDKSTNRRCQTGSIAEVAVTDTTAPTASNPTSDKIVGDTSWAMGFTVADNSPVSQISVKIYRDTGSFPSEMSPGTPVYSSPTNVTIDGGSGLVSFTDTGTGSGPEYYYLAEVSDAANNKVFITFRDMPPPPNITSVSFTGGSAANGEVLPDVIDFQRPQIQTLVVNGNDFEFVDTVQIRTNANNFVASCAIQNKTSTQITCILDDRPNAYGGHRVRVITPSSGGAQRFTTDPDAISFSEFCDLTTDRTAMLGLGTAQSPYGICFPEHLNLITNANYNGFFRLMQNMDFVADAQSPVVFSGTDIDDPDLFKINGNGYTIDKLTVSPASSGTYYGFVRRMAATASSPVPIFENINFTNGVLTVSLSSTVNYAGFLIGTFEGSGVEVPPLVDVSVDGLIVDMSNRVTGALGGLIGRLARSGNTNSVLNQGISLNNAVFNLNEVASIFGGIVGNFGLRNGVHELSNMQISNVVVNENVRAPFLGGITGLINVSSNATAVQYSVNNNTVSNFVVEKITDGGSHGGLIGGVGWHPSAHCLPAGCKVANNETDFTINTNASSGSISYSYGGLVGDGEVSEYNEYSRNKTNFTFVGAGEERAVGGLFGRMTAKRFTGNALVQASYVQENSTTVSAINVNRDLGGLIGQFEPGFNETNLEVNILNNKVSAPTTFSSATDISGLIGRCTFNGNTSYVVNIENNLVLATYNGFDLDHDPFTANHSTGECQTEPGITYNYITNYYDSTLSGGNSSAFEGVDDVEGRTTVELQGAPSGTLYNGWDFSGVWLDRSGSSQAPSLLWE